MESPPDVDRPAAETPAETATVWDRLGRERVIAMVVIDDVSNAVPTVSALMEGGINAIELALRTPSAVQALGRIRAAAPGLVLGAGTVLTPQQVHECRDAGADFAVSPGLNPRVVREAEAVGLPFAPGIATPSDIEAAVELGCRHLKFFPAEPSGGMAYLASVAAPFQHLGLRFIPLGGIDQTNITRYHGHPLILAVGGSWICPPEHVREKNWSEITIAAKQLLNHLANQPAPRR